MRLIKVEPFKTKVFDFVIRMGKGEPYKGLQSGAMEIHVTTEELNELLKRIMEAIMIQESKVHGLKEIKGETG